jgi:hypothetical protein
MFWADNLISGNIGAGWYNYEVYSYNIDFRIFANWDAYEGGDGNLIYYYNHQFILTNFKFYVNVPYSTAPSNLNLVVNSFVYDNVNDLSRLTFTAIAPLLLRSHTNLCCDVYYSYFYLHLYGIDIARTGTGGTTCRARVINPAGSIYTINPYIPCALIIGGDYPVYQITIDDRRDGINDDWNAGVAWTWEIDFFGYNWDNHDRNYMWMHLWGQNLFAGCYYCCGCCCCLGFGGCGGWVNNYWLL